MQFDRECDTRELCRKKHLKITTTNKTTEARVTIGFSENIILLSLIIFVDKKKFHEINFEARSPWFFNGFAEHFKKEKKVWKNCKKNHH